MNNVSIKNAGQYIGSDVDFGKQRIGVSDVFVAGKLKSVIVTKSGGYFVQVESLTKVTSLYLPSAATFRVLRHEVKACELNKEHIGSLITHEDGRGKLIDYVSKAFGTVLICTQFFNSVQVHELKANTKILVSLCYDASYGDDDDSELPY